MGAPIWSDDGYVSAEVLEIAGEPIELWVGCILEIRGIVMPALQLGVPRIVNQDFTLSFALSLAPVDYYEIPSGTVTELGVESLLEVLT